jgi:Streptomyces sporulation and cell division protein, SsgA
LDSSMVSAELGVWLVLPEQKIVALAASLVYSREDPYAVRIGFHVGLDVPIEWTFARDLLSTGIEERDGLGDVTVWPSAGSESGGLGSVLNLKLSSPFGDAHFEVPARSISDFLRRMYQLVPAGEESEHIDVEAGLNDLLRQAS